MASKQNLAPKEYAWGTNPVPGVADARAVQVRVIRPGRDPDAGPVHVSRIERRGRSDRRSDSPSLERPPMTRPIGRREFLARHRRRLAAAVTGVVARAATRSAEAQEGRQVRHDRRRATAPRASSSSLKKSASRASRSTARGTSNLDELVEGAARRPASRSTASSTRSTGATRSRTRTRRSGRRGSTALKGALEDAKTVGADTVLLVPGVVNKDVTYEQC